MVTLPWFTNKIKVYSSVESNSSSPLRGSQRTQLTVTRVHNTVTGGKKWFSILFHLFCLDKNGFVPSAWKTNDCRGDAFGTWDPTTKNFSLLKVLPLNNYFSPATCYSLSSHCCHCACCYCSCYSN